MRLYYAIILSFLVHMGWYYTAPHILSHFDTFSQDDNIEIVLVDPKKYKIIMNPVTPKPDSDENTPTPLLSEKNQRFKEQSQAAHIGETVNRSPKKRSQKQQQKQLEERLEALADLSEQLIKKLKQEVDSGPTVQNYQGFDPSPAPSTVNDPITNIPMGSFTAMNTNRYLFYSYFRRIEQQIRYRWVRKIRNVISRRPYVKRAERSKEIWGSQLEVILDDKGHFVRGDIHRSSGISGFDVAAIDSFREGAPILNPPKGLVEPDGLIRLQYNFNVYWKPSNSY